MRVVVGSWLSLLLLFWGCASDEDDVARNGPDGGGKDGDVIDAGEDAATISTATLDFGGTILGTAGSLFFTIENRTDMPVVINVPAIAGAPDFTLSDSPGMVTMAPNDSISVTVEYRPSAAVPHLARLSVSLCEEGCVIDVQISGFGLVEAISCAPVPVDFGFVNPNACAQRDVLCTNVSARDATILDARLASTSAPAFSMIATPATPATLAGGTALTLTVEYCPTELLNHAGTIALTIDHPDPRYTTKAIALFGTGGGPDIECTARVDFGAVGVGQSGERSATCTNRGNVPLLVSRAELAPGGSSELSASLSVTPPITLDAGESFDVTFAFSATAVGVHSAAFSVDSNDTDTPRAMIEVTAEVLDTAGCSIAVSPQVIDFGAVAPGASSEAAASVRNTGTGICAVDVIGLSSTTAPEFSLVGGARSVNLAPNQSLAVRVRFRPITEGRLGGTVELSTSDPSNSTPTIAFSGEGLSLLGSVRATPSVVDFGRVQAGCTNVLERQFSVQNGGSAPADVVVTLEAGTAAEFGLSPPLPNPISIAAGASADFRVTFQPGAAGVFIGRVRISIANGPTIYVLLAGEGSPMAGTTVTFPAQPTPEIDLLLVIDDSCSMSEEQQQLAVAAPILIGVGDSSGAEYHIGVTTTDGAPGISGTLRGSPTVVTWTSASRNQELQANLNRGVQGAPIEEGLRTATEAVTDSALLSGANAGFLRPNADLVIIVLSDEEDQSPGLVTDYLDRLTTTRPIGAPGTPRIFTITGGLTGCATADMGRRYVDAANLSGGFDRSICTPDYTAIITEIAEACFAPARTRLRLPASPVPGSVVVRVNGTTLTTNEWSFDYTTDEVVFANGIVPRLSDEVAIDYAARCVPASCGDGTPNAGEQCDDANADNTDLCLDVCLDAFCGDSFIRASEQCDDGNTIPGDGCDSVCTIE